MPTILNLFASEATFDALDPVSTPHDRIAEVGVALALAADAAQAAAYEATLDMVEARRSSGTLRRGQAIWLRSNVPAWLAHRILEDEAEAWRLEHDLDPEPVEALRAYAPVTGPREDSTPRMSDDVTIDGAIVPMGDLLAFGGAL